MLGEVGGGRGGEGGGEKGMEKHLSVEQVAVAMGVSEMTVVRRIKGGQLEAVKFGAQWRVPVSALKRGG